MSWEFSFLHSFLVPSQCVWSHCSNNLVLVCSLFRWHLLWKNGRQQSVKLKLFPECMFYLGCSMPVSSGICQQKMLGAKFVERKVHLFANVGVLDILKMSFLPKRILYTQTFSVWGRFSLSWKSIKCYFLKSHDGGSEQALCSSV